MAVSTEDIVQGNNARLSVKGWEFDRIFIVTELTSFGSDKLVEAVQATNIPFGQSHPSISAAFALEFIPESLESADAAKVTIRYREYAQDYVTEIGSRVLTKETSKAFNDPNASDGDPLTMRLSYLYPPGHRASAELEGVAADNGFIADQGVNVSVQNYFPTIIITRTEFTTITADFDNGYAIGIPLTGEILTDRAKVFNGKLNKSGWNIRPFDEEHVWRLEMSAVSAEDGLAYRVRYAFAYDPDKWSYLAVYVNPYSGQPINNPENPLPDDPLSSSEADYPMYLAEDFTALELI